MAATYTGGHIGAGIKVAYAVGSPHVWLKFEQVEDVTPPQITPDKIDTTVHQVTTRFKSNIPGMEQVSDVIIKMLRNADPVTAPNQNALPGLVQASTTVWLRIEVPATANPGVDNLYSAYELTGRFANKKEITPLMQKVELETSFMFDGGSYAEYNPAASLLP